MKQKKLQPHNLGLLQKIAQYRRQAYSIKEKEIYRKWAKPEKEILEIENLVLEGGGIKGLAYLGAFKGLEKYIDFNRIKRIGGSSAGAITTVLLGVGYSLPELKEILDNFNFEELLDGDFKDQILDWIQNETLEKIGNRAISDISNIKNISYNPMKASTSTSDIVSLSLNKDVRKIMKAFKMLNQNGFGFFSGERLLDWIEELLQQKFGRTFLTFRELKEIGIENPELGIKDIYLTGTNLNRAAQVFSFETTPDMIISDALRISTSIPFIFKAHQIHIKDKDGRRILAEQEGFYIDGGVLNNYPFWLFQGPKFASSYQLDNNPQNQKTLGLRLVNSKLIEQYSQQNHLEAPAITDLSRYIWQILQLFYNKQESDHILRGEISSTIYIDHHDISTVAFNLSDVQKSILLENGEKAVDTYFLKRNIIDINALVINALNNESTKEIKSTFKKFGDEKFFVDKNNNSILDVALQQQSNAHNIWLIPKLVKLGFFRCSEPEKVIKILDIAEDSPFVKQKHKAINKFRNLYFK